MYSLDTSISESQRRAYAQRLITLAQLLQSLKPAQYQHDCWVRCYDPEDSSKTVACALGHAATRPDLFPGIGLSVLNRGYNDAPWWIIYPISNLQISSEKYFGYGTFYDVFIATRRSRGKGGYCDVGLSRTNVIKRLLKIAREQYGYEPA